MLSFFKNRKGCLNLQVSSGYLYSAKKALPDKDKSYCVCVSKERDACPATAITVTSSKVMVKQTGEHTHSNRLVERKVKEVEQENIAAAALLPTVAPRSVLGAIAVNLKTSMPGTSGFISSCHTINQAIHKARKQLKGYTPKNKMFDDLLEIPGQFSKTADGQQFLVLNDTVIPDNPAPSAPRILVFLSQHGKEVLAGCKS
jgi:hypothetical protein